MIANYHTHTARCRHAVGYEDAYVQCAIERGLKILGFSDHTPQWFPGSYYSGMRMFPSQLEGYCGTVRLLRDKYADRIRIHLGLEVEYYPAIFPELRSRLRDAGVEYMLLGQHWIGNEEGAPYCGRMTGDGTVLQQYCRQAMQAMELGCFTYLAHPDLIHYVGSRRIYESHMRQLCRCARETGTPLEINFLGLSSGRHYPNEAFWAMAAEEGCNAVFGVDAHAPEHLLDTQSEETARKMVKHYCLPLLDTVPFRKI